MKVPSVSYSFYTYRLQQSRPRFGHAVPNPHQKQVLDKDYGNGVTGIAVLKAYQKTEGPSDPTISLDRVKQEFEPEQGPAVELATQALNEAALIVMGEQHGYPPGQGNITAQGDEMSTYEGPKA